MKNKLSIILTIAGALTFSSCHKDLDVVQDSQLSANNMWTEQSDAESAMLGAHQRMRAAFSQGLAFWGEYRTGLWGAGNHGGLSQAERDRTYQNTMDNTHTYADWESLYTTINQTNLVIKYTPDIAFSNASRKNEVLANAYFIRANCYYWIARIWGDAPLVLEGYESANQNLRPNRSSAKEIYKQVELDLEQALTFMPENINAKKTVSRGAIQMLKADYSLWMYKTQQGGEEYLQKAQTAVQSVLMTNGYSLQSDYSKIFASNAEAGSEIIFAWNYQQEEYTGGYPHDFQFNSATVSAKYHYNPIVVGTRQQWTFYTDSYIDLITEDVRDSRIATNYQTFYDDGMKQEFVWTNKYKGSWINNTLVLDSDIILYRLAEAHLFDAEIKLYQKDLPKAIASLNTIAQRAYKVVGYYSPNLSEAEVKNAIVEERMKEFPAEGKLWWDFIRLGVVFDKNPYLKGKENQQNILLWPISDNSINDNPNLGGQTPGWN